MATYFQAINDKGKIQINDGEERMALYRHFNLDQAYYFDGFEIACNYTMGDEDISYYKSWVETSRKQYVSGRFVVFKIPRISENEIISAINGKDAGQGIVLRSYIDYKENKICVDVWFDITTSLLASDIDFTKIHIYTFGYTSDMGIYEAGNLLEIRDAQNKVIFCNQRFPLKIVNSYFIDDTAWKKNAINDVSLDFLDRSIGAENFLTKEIACSSGKFFSPIICATKLSSQYQLLFGFYGFSWNTGYARYIASAGCWIFGLAIPTAHDSIGVSRGGNGLLVDVTNAPYIY